MAAPEQDLSFVDRLSRQGEEVLGKIAEELISNPVINGAIARTFEAREKALQAQEATVAAGYSRNQEKAEAFKAELEQIGAHASIHQGNVASSDDC